MRDKAAKFESKDKNERGQGIKRHARKEKLQ